MVKPKITLFEHKNVNADGTFSDKLGSVHVEGHVQLSYKDGGCGLEGCNCSPGHFIAVGLPVDENNIVRGMTIRFKSRKELLDYLKIGDDEL